MRILVVDDHPQIIFATRAILKGFDERAQVESADNLAAALDAASRTRFDLVMLDLGIPGCAGLEALMAFRQRFPAQPVVVVSGSDQPRLMSEAISAGAAGFIPKSGATSDRFTAALRLVLAGGTYVPPEALLAREGENAPKAQAPQLTGRQDEVFALVMEGLSNKMIARRLNIAENTVKIHVSNLLKKLQVDTRAKAIVKGSRLGWRGAGETGGGMAKPPQ
jgi:DNA-binding NarL/FixJ family response regulator